MKNPTTQTAAFNTRIEADVAVARLADAGIMSFVMADNLGGTFPLMQMTTGGFKIHVRTEDKQRAKDALAKHYPPIEARPGADVSVFQRAARGVASPKATRVRVALYIALTFLAVVAVALSTTRGTL